MYKGQTMARAADGWKVCSACEERQPISEFHKNRTTADGLEYWCKECRSIFDQQRRQRLKDNGPTIARTTKVCTQCSERKPISEFYRNPTTLDGHLSCCKICHNVRSKARYEANRKEILAQHAEYRTTPADKAAHQRYTQTAGGKQAILQAARRRRAQKAGCVGSHTPAEFLALCERYDFRCLRHNEVFPFAELTEDHVIPIGPGVSDRIDNIQPLCKSCNSWKGRRTIDYRSQVGLESL